MKGKIDKCKSSKENSDFYLQQKKFFKENDQADQFIGLINKIKVCHKCTKNSLSTQKYLINPFQEFEGKEYLLPYTTNYWSDICFHAPSDIVFLGQDWGGVNSVPNYIKNDRKETGNPTRKNLEAGIKRINCRERSFFINSALCLRDGTDTSKEHFDYKFISNCKEHILSHFEIIKPKIVVTIGEEVSKKYIDQYGKKSFSDVVSQPYWNKENKWFVFPIFHLGFSGQQNRRRYGKNGKFVSENYLYDFDLIKLLLISIYLVNNFNNNICIDGIKESLEKDLHEYKNDIRNIIELLQKDNFFENILIKNSYEEKVISIYKTIADKMVLSKPDFKMKITEKLSTTQKIVYDDKKVYWFINVGEYDNNTKEKVRFWENNKKYSFISFGHGGINLNLKNEIKKGHYAFVYVNKIGYVAYGEIIGEASELEGFQNKDGMRIEDMDLLNKSYLLEIEANCEYFIPVKWQQILDENNPVRYNEVHPFKQTFCRINDVNIKNNLIDAFNSK